jgi:orotidine-5'-phosphate decarboxylase
MKMANRRSWQELLAGRWADGKLLCVGLDPTLDMIPKSIRHRHAGKPHETEDTLWDFLTGIVDATHEHVGAYKPNVAFFECFGFRGLRVLEALISYIHEADPSIPVILDAKRGDIGSSNVGYAQMAFKAMRADAVTVHPYLGREAMMPFLERRDKGVIVLCRTSNRGAGEFQDLAVGGRPMHELVAERVAAEWNTNGNCGVVVGAMRLEADTGASSGELARIRAIVGDMPILIPGIGAQGGEVRVTVEAGRDSRGAGILIAASRSVIYASSGEDYAEAAAAEAMRLSDLINRCRKDQA